MGSGAPALGCALLACIPQTPTLPPHTQPQITDADDVDEDDDEDGDIEYINLGDKLVGGRRL